MESTSSGRFRDYDFPKSSPPKGTEETGTEEEVDVCIQPIENARLVEIERSEYFKTKKQVPAEGLKILLRKELSKGRLVVETKAGQSIGFLPTKYSYLRLCMQKGFSYKGEVVASALTPVPKIFVDLSR